MGTPKPPKAPDPKVQAGAQTGTNISTAIANNTMGMMDQNTPFGSLSYDQTGSYDWTDPNTGEVYNLPRYTATTTLDPSQQAMLDANNRAGIAMSNLAANQADFLGDYLGQGMDISGLPGRGNLPTARDYGGVDLNTGGIARGGITRSYGADDFSADRQKVEDALMQRMQPYLDRDRDAMETRLANQGIGRGAEAYSSAEDDFGRKVTDARLGAILSAGQEQSRLTGMDRDRALFQNAAQGQEFGQNLAERNTMNQALLSEAGFNNNAQSMGFNDRMALARAQDAQRSGALQEQFALRNQPINEITALLSGGQVQAPNFAVAQPSQMPTVDVAGLMGQQYANQYQNYANQVNQRNALFGGIMGGGATLLGAPAGSVFGGLFQ